MEVPKSKDANSLQHGALCRIHCSGPSAESRRQAVRVEYGWLHGRWLKSMGFDVCCYHPLNSTAPSGRRLGKEGAFPGRLHQL